MVVAIVKFCFLFAMTLCLLPVLIAGFLARLVARIAAAGWWYGDSFIHWLTHD